MLTFLNQQCLVSFHKACPLFINYARFACSFQAYDGLNGFGHFIYVHAKQFIKFNDSNNFILPYVPATEG